MQGIHGEVHRPMRERQVLPVFEVSPLQIAASPDRQEFPHEIVSVTDQRIVGEPILPVVQLFHIILSSQVLDHT